MRYTKGFTYKSKPYGWYKKELYKLPFENGKRGYNLLKCSKWLDKNDKHVGFKLGSDRKSFAQLKKMTHDIDVEIKEHKDTPF